MITPEIVRLRAENEILRLEVASLKAALSPGLVFPPEWRLTKHEARLLEVLTARPFASVHAIMTALYSDAWNEPHPKAVTVWVHHVRKKVGPFGIEIETIRSRGYRLDPTNKERVLVACEAAVCGQPGRLGEKAPAGPVLYCRGAHETRTFTDANGHPAGHGTAALVANA